ncbi:cysteine peptidase family C39 domain-containing protein [Streptococcus mutans]|uniref:ATP-binding cassette domain-containing protein n=1 Tax=Streptococcus mutans TaxID=1309 RepID=A0AAX1K2Q6_STRMG|nr:cysteine peptidase family C39 domain-containing protein [Streptococcus mutans]EMC02705.1 NukT [Streptococcus mutans N34]EMC08268.1 NukT [Streptococcus mutans NLML5]EMC41575.1 NukT [Streptococcus mutans SM1]MBT3148481.1 ATP-binding cassette domain-containing protein [Streptococcus mutans]MBW3480172.1 ATP-binding cassette domain-containing protein [Streptococcus mutans]
MKLVLQNNEQDCLIACYAMILSSFGCNVSLEDLYLDEYIPPDGLSVSYLHSLNTKFRLKMQVLKGDGQQVLEYIYQHKCKAIAYWKNSHFVVVDKCTKKSVNIMDPSLGTITIPISSFLDNFSSYILIFSKQSNYRPVKINSPLTGLIKITYTGLNLVEYIGALFLIELVSIIYAVYLRGILNQNIKWLSSLLIGTTLLIFRFIGYLLETKGQIKSNIKYEKNVTKSLFQGTLSHSLLFFRNNTPGSILEKVNLKSRIRDSIQTQLIPSIINIFSLLVLSIYLFIVSRLLAFLSILLLIIYAIINYLIYRKILNANLKYVQQTITVSDKIQEGLSQIDQIKTQGTEDTWEKEWVDSSMNSQILYNDILSLQSLSNLVNQLFTISSTVILMYSGIFLISLNKINMADLVLFQTLFVSLLSSVVQFQSSLLEISNLSVYSKKIQSLFTRFKRKPDQIIPNDHYVLKAKDVSFSYYGNKQVIKDFNLTIRQGEKIVILGESGSGKTTLLNVLLGLYNYQGDISYGIEDFRKKLGVVTQNMNLTSGPLIKNLIGNSIITSKILNEVNFAINAVNMMEAINQMPKKIFSNLFQQGKNLSGGQVQRLLVARSLLNNSQLLIWDEPFSNLDNLNRELIYSNILNSEQYNNKTIILSSHHTDCIKYMDRIIFINSNGQIDIGSDAELRIRNLEYKQFIGMNKGEKYDETIVIN